MDRARVSARNAQQHMERAWDELRRRGLVGHDTSEPELTIQLALSRVHLEKAVAAVGAKPQAALDELDGALEALKRAHEMLSLNGVLPPFHADSVAAPGQPKAALRRAFVRTRANIVELAGVLGEQLEENAEGGA